MSEVAEQQLPNEIFNAGEQEEVEMSLDQSAKDVHPRQASVNRAKAEMTTVSMSHLQKFVSSKK